MTGSLDRFPDGADDRVPLLPLPAITQVIVDALPEAGRRLTSAVTRRHAVGRDAPAPDPSWPERSVPDLPIPAAVGRPAAVLVLLAPAPADSPSRAHPHDPRGDGADDVTVVLLERAAGLRSHPGQVAFPGGSLDPADGGDVVAAALRESREEVGAPGATVVVLGRLPTVPVPPRPVPVTPVVAWETHPAPLTPGDPGEVASAVRVSLRALAEPDRRHSVRAGSGWVGPAFTVGDLTVWGFTALVLDCLLSASGLAQPWDAARIVALPSRFGGSHRAAGALAVPDGRG